MKLALPSFISQIPKWTSKDLKAHRQVKYLNISFNDSSDEDRQPIEQASANRSRRPKQQIYQASLPGTSMEQRQRDHSGLSNDRSKTSRFEPPKQHDDSTSDQQTCQ